MCFSNKTQQDVLSRLYGSKLTKFKEIKNKKTSEKICGFIIEIPH